VSNPKPVSGTALVLTMAAVVLFIIAAVVVIAVAVPEGGNPGSLIAILIGSLAPTLAAIAAVAKIGNVEQRVEQVAADTSDLANGRGDAKMRAAVATVIGDEQVHPDARAQVAEDRIRLAGPRDPSPS